MQRIGIVTSPGFHIINVAAAFVFEVANSCLEERRYEVCFLSESGGLIAGPNGTCVETRSFDALTIFDTLIVDGGDPSAAPTEAVLDFVRRAPHISRRVAATGAGTFVLAEAGLLDSKRVTTHWAHASELRLRYPKIQVEEDKIFIADGSIWTTAGMTASWDLMIAMIEMDVGRLVAQEVAKRMVMHHRRSGAHPQLSTMLQLEPRSDRIQRVLAYAEQNLRAPLTVEELARVANLSPRQFTRAFHAETGESPAKAVEKLRIESARLMMEQGRHPIEFIAQETGFADRERMRRAFRRAFGQSPQIVRRNVQQKNHSQRSFLDRELGRSRLRGLRTCESGHFRNRCCWCAESRDARITPLSARS
jgi:transcriptional regulator GlxA family with amidase domain